MTLSIFLALCSAMMMPAIVGFLDSMLSLRLSSVPFVFCYTHSRNRLGRVFDDKRVYKPLFCPNR